MPILKKFLKGGAKTASVVGAHMNDRWGFEEKKKKLKLGSVSAFVRLFPEEFQFNSSGRIQLRNQPPRQRMTISGVQETQAAARASAPPAPKRRPRPSLRAGF